MPTKNPVIPSSWIRSFCAGSTISVLKTATPAVPPPQELIRRGLEQLEKKKKNKNAAIESPFFQEVPWMKKVIFGSALFASGFLSLALLLAGTLSTELTNDSARSLALWRLSYVGLMPFFICPSLWLPSACSWPCGGLLEPKIKAHGGLYFCRPRTRAEQGFPGEHHRERARKHRIPTPKPPCHKGRGLAQEPISHPQTSGRSQQIDQDPSPAGGR